MSLKYYLFCRDSYDKILKELEYIISIYKDIDDHISSEKELLNNSDIVFSNQNHNKNFFFERKQHITILKRMCDLKISQLCCHEMVDDLIDISPDKSQLIRYCSICEYTEPNRLL
jgi:hypothetical protein